MRVSFIAATFVVLCHFIALASCSKKTGDDAKSGESLDQNGATAVTSTEANLPKKNIEATKSGDRTPTVKEQRLMSVAQQIDQVESQRKKLTIEETGKRLALNKLRGVPGDTPVDITKPTVAQDSKIGGEQEALDAYLLTALELQTLDAKEKIFTEQLQRLRDAADDKPGEEN
jgi:hypothetical protein